MSIPNFPSLLNAMLVRGIYLGVLVGIVGLIFFWRSLNSQFTTPTIVGFRPFLLRFVEGTAIGIGIVVVLIWGGYYVFGLWVQRHYGA